MGSLALLVSPAQGNARFLTLRRVTLAVGEEVRLSTAGEEHVLDVLAGKCAVEMESGGQVWDFPGVGGRPDIFGGRPEFVYAPRDASYTVRCLASPFEAVCYSAPTEDAGLPAYLPGEEVAQVASGVSDWRRDVYIGMGDRGPATRMLIGETESPPGNWSGFPPHRHTEERPPDEAYMEELYYLKFAPASGFAIGAIYQSPAERAATAQLSLVHDSQPFGVPGGYHFISPCPGYRLRYTWALGGPAPRFGAWRADPDLAWLAGYKEE